ncbi:MAG: hypothetical protein LBI91_03130 [Spirochaetaceae bacterium]|nr:hypothetical protein [Spirochaetaceae bacterium]
MNEKKREYNEFLHGMKRLSEKGRDYIKDITQAMLLYQKGLLSGSAAGGQAGKREKKPGLPKDSGN